jgi:protein-S-isoprenylcysteine O-methyltransferase Ste14
MNQAKLPKGAVIWMLALVFLTEAAFHGFVQHDWFRAATDVVSIFFAAFVYWYVRYVWIKISNALRARNDRKTGHK